MSVSLVGRNIAEVALSHLIAFMLSKRAALHRCREVGSGCTHGWGYECPLQGGHQDLGPVHNCCCALVAYQIARHEVNLHYAPTVSESVMELL